jgi:hypothetical protein
MRSRHHAAPSDILAWIRAGATDPERFDSLALDLFAYQFGANPVYRNYCLALGASPAAVANWEEIPALPCDAFKLETLPVRCFPRSEVARVFLTSGTSGGVRGRHEFAGTEAYEASLRTGWRLLGLAPLENPWFLTPAPTAARDSSLVHMFATLAPAHAGDPQRWMLRAGHLDLDGLRAALAAGEPVELLGTALAFLEVLETSAPLPLPPGSWLLETGGYKGSGRSLEKPAFYERLSRHFNVAIEEIHNEYGMTEISSPFYTRGLAATHRGAPWTGVRVIDPHTGRACAEGETGYLEIVDLANLGSVLAVRTQDFAMRHGPREFSLLGRDPGALPRGCSRAAAELLASGPR